MTVFLGVYQAVYDYEPQAPEELKIVENDILYLLQRSDVDDWWTVKKRIIGSDEEEPSGLVPSNYIEEMKPIGQIVAMYDYDQVQNPEEELSFREMDTFDLYDDKDPDWLLCKNVAKNEYGFVPGNYVEHRETQVVGQPVQPVQPVSSFLPPPVRVDRQEYTPEPERENEEREDEEEEEEAVPPPQPARPTATTSISTRSADDFSMAPPKPTRPIVDEDGYRDSYRSQARSSSPTPQQQQQQSNLTRQSTQRRDARNSYVAHEDTEDFLSWKISEIVGRKKKQANLSIGNNTIVFASSSSVDGQPQQWNIKNLISYSNEKKHLFLDFSNPPASLELHTGTTDVANQIIKTLGELKGGYSSKMLNEVKEASTATPSASSSGSSGSGSSTQRQGKVVYDFMAESPDELTIKTGDIVYILNDTNSKDWWLCELANSRGKKKGVVPAQFIKPINQLSALANNTKPNGYDNDNDYEKKNEGSKTKKLLRSLTGKKNKTESPSSIANDDDYFSGLPSQGKNNSNNNEQRLTSQHTGSWKADNYQSISGSKKYAAATTPTTTSSSTDNNRKRSSSTSSKKKDKEFPNQKKVRTWVDKSGSFKVEAEFIGSSQGKVHLHKVNGVKIAVPADKLSLADIEYVEQATGFSLDKYKIDDKPKNSTSADTSSNDGQRARDKERERRRKAKEREERERDRSIREQEIEELRKARELLDQERAKLREEKQRAREKELPPVKPPRPNEQQQPLKPTSTGHYTNSSRPPYDWFEFFLNCGVDVNNCQRYTINFEREDITEDILPEIQPSLLRTLGLREGDIVRVMKTLDTKFGRIQTQITGAPTGGLFSEADGSLKINNASSSSTSASQNKAVDEDAWTIKPAASNPTSVQSKSEFSGSMQDLLDLNPLESNVSPAPKPLKELQQVNTSTPALAPSAPAPSATKPLSTSNTGSGLNPDDLIPLNPFKTGGNNVLPMFMMPIMTGGAMMPIATGGAMMPQTTFGAIQPIGQASNGGFILPVQKTGGGLVPASLTGGGFPQTSFATGNMTGNAMAMPQLSFSQPAFTGGAMPQQSFGQPAFTGGAMPQQSFGQPTFTGGSMPQNTFGQPTLTGGAMPSNTFGQQQPFGQPTLTGGAMPQNTFGQQPFGQPTFTGGAMPQNTFGQQQAFTGGAMPNALGQQTTGGFVPQSTFGMTLQRTGGVAPMPQTSFGSNSQPQMNNLNASMQNMNIYNHQQPLQNQPTGFGFGNGSQQPLHPQTTAANLYNASADNPFGF